MKWDERFEREGGRFENRPLRTGFKWLIGIVVLSLAISAIFGVASWVSSWGGEAKRIASPTNVREQYTEVIGDYKAMEQAAINACDAVASKGASSDPSLIEKPDFAYRATYRRIAVDFNRRQNNLFEAGIVGPHGYPKDAPSLAEMQARVC